MPELRGKPVADRLTEKLKEEIAKEIYKGYVPTLAIICVGNESSSEAYKKGAVNRAEKIGINVEIFDFPDNIDESEVISKISSLNIKSDIDGILLLQPLPRNMNADKVRESIDFKKDVDCTSDRTIGMFFAGSENSFAPCTAESVMEILKFYEVDVEGKRATVIGRSMVIGKPVATMLLQENATVTTCHSRTTEEDLRDIISSSDIVVTAAGKIGTVDKKMMRRGQTIIDVGINFTKEGKMTGDVCYQDAIDSEVNITPVPGGVGSVTTTILMKHVVERFKRKFSEV